ncbi:hypothetical protein U9M48_037709, partial [Paspalum notatum var. saurae]
HQSSLRLQNCRPEARASPPRQTPRPAATSLAQPALAARSSFALAPPLPWAEQLSLTVVHDHAHALLCLRIHPRAALPSSSLSHASIPWTERLNHVSKAAAFVVVVTRHTWSLIFSSRRSPDDLLAEHKRQRDRKRYAQMPMQQKEELLRKRREACQQKKVVTINDDVKAHQLPGDFTSPSIKTLAQDNIVDIVDYTHDPNIQGTLESHLLLYFNILFLV